MKTKRLSKSKIIILSSICVSVAALILISILCIQIHTVKEKENIKAQIIAKFEDAASDTSWCALQGEEKWAFLAIDQSDLDSLSTEDLTDCALVYPLLGDILLFDQPNYAFDYFTRTSALFETLFNREDTAHVFLLKYENLVGNYSLDKSERADAIRNLPRDDYYKALFLEGYIRYNFDKLPDIDRERLIKHNSSS